MFKFLFLAFLTVPLAELYVLIRVGSEFGAINTIGLCLFTAALGAFLFRLQGIETIKRVEKQVKTGKMPATELVEGFILLISGFLLLTPGFITDIAGFLCLVPGLRMEVASWILSRLIIHHRKVDEQTVIIDGEFWDEENRRISNDDGQDNVGKT
jgi:UPF0716 protein FxsA